VGGLDRVVEVADAAGEVGRFGELPGVPIGSIWEPGSMMAWSRLLVARLGDTGTGTGGRSPTRCGIPWDRENAPVTDEQQIRELIERWAQAAHEGDLAVVLADHAPDIVMFDVPPPEDLARDPDHRLRLTVGQRRAGDRWVVAHEHHSFADASDA
jgi:hypothetical protein